VTGSDTWQMEMKYTFPGPQRLRTLPLLYFLYINVVNCNHGHTHLHTFSPLLLCCQNRWWSSLLSTSTPAVRTVGTEAPSLWKNLRSWSMIVIAHSLMKLWVEYLLVPLALLHSTLPLT